MHFISGRKSAFYPAATLRPLRLRVSDRCSHTGFVDEGLGGIVDGPTLAAFRG